MLSVRAVNHFLISIQAIVFFLCNSAAIAANRPVVYTVNYPLQYFAKRIAGDLAKVILPVPVDADPAFWQPDAEIIGEIQRADLILLNGAGYARWVSRISLPRRKLVDTSAVFSGRYIDTEGTVTHSHGREGKHSHAGIAFTTWLDFSQAAAQAKAVRDALSKLMPEQAGIINANFVRLEQDLLDLDAGMKAVVARDPEKTLIASHPVYQYLKRRYAIQLKSVLWEPNALPLETEWQKLAKLREGHPVEWMLWEDDPIPETKVRLMQLGIQSTVFNPCGNRPETGDFLSVMHDNLTNLTQVFD